MHDTCLTVKKKLMFLFGRKKDATRRKILFFHCIISLFRILYNIVLTNTLRAMHGLCFMDF